MVYSTRLESVRAQALVGPNPTSSAVVCGSVFVWRDGLR